MFARGGVLFHRGTLHAVLVICAVSMSVPRFARAQQNHEVIVQNGVSMKTRDGVTLRADIYRPRDDGKFPVILMRTPYDKSSGWAVSPGYQIAAHGYVVVVQDVRGRYTSDGDFYPFLHESNDGYDTVEWVAALPYSNGKVGMMGAPTSVQHKCWLRSLTLPISRNLSRGDGEQLSRWLDVSRRSARAVV